MSQATLQRILSEVEELSGEEKAKLIQALNNHSEDRNEDARVEAFHLALLASGMVKEIKKSDSMRREPSPPLIKITGEPISETVIRERR